MPENDVARIQAWCRGQVPERLWDELRIDCDVTPRHVTIVEVRPPWDGIGEHTRFEIARLRWVSATGRWSLYWRDRHVKFHLYARIKPTANVGRLLEYLDSREDPIFRG